MMGWIVPAVGALFWLYLVVGSSQGLAEQAAVGVKSSAAQCIDKSSSAYQHIFPVPIEYDHIEPVKTHEFDMVQPLDYHMGIVHIPLNFGYKRTSDYNKISWHEDKGEFCMQPRGHDIVCIRPMEFTGAKSGRGRLYQWEHGTNSELTMLVNNVFACHTSQLRQMIMMDATCVSATGQSGGWRILVGSTMDESQTWIAILYTQNGTFSGNPYIRGLDKLVTWHYETYEPIHVFALYKNPAEHFAYKDLCIPPETTYFDKKPRFQAPNPAGGARVRRDLVHSKVNSKVYRRGRRYRRETQSEKFTGVEEAEHDIEIPKCDKGKVAAKNNGPDGTWQCEDPPPMDCPQSRAGGVRLSLTLTLSTILFVVGYKL